MEAKKEGKEHTVHLKQAKNGKQEKESETELGTLLRELNKVQALLQDRWERLDAVSKRDQATAGEGADKRPKGQINREKLGEHSLPTKVQSRGGGGQG